MLKSFIILGHDIERHEEGTKQRCNNDNSSSARERRFV